MCLNDQKNLSSNSFRCIVLLVNVLNNNVAITTLTFKLSVRSCTQYMQKLNAFYQNECFFDIPVDHKSQAKCIWFKSNGSLINL